MFSRGGRQRRGRAPPTSPANRTRSAGNGCAAARRMAAACPAPVRRYPVGPCRHNPPPRPFRELPRRSLPWAAMAAAGRLRRRLLLLAVPWRCSPRRGGGSCPSAGQVRAAFLQFFQERHGHRRLPSAPVRPRGDTSLLFVNAGMNQVLPCLHRPGAPALPRLRPAPQVLPIAFPGRPRPRMSTARLGVVSFTEVSCGGTGSHLDLGHRCAHAHTAPVRFSSCCVCVSGAAGTAPVLGGR